MCPPIPCLSATKVIPAGKVRTPSIFLLFYMLKNKINDPIFLILPQGVRKILHDVFICKGFYRLILFTQFWLVYVISAIRFRVEKIFFTFKSGNIFRTTCNLVLYNFHITAKAKFQRHLP